MAKLRLLKFDAHEYAAQTKSRKSEIERDSTDGCPRSYGFIACLPVVTGGLILNNYFSLIATTCPPKLT